jgi:plastocyanin
MPVSRFAAAALLGLAATASAQPVAAPAYVIALYSYGYQPNPIVLRAGRPVTLTFVNRAGKGHDFTAPKFFRSSRILAGNVGSGEVGMGPGQSRSVTLIPAAGRYGVHCGHPFHKVLGMRGDIVVR